MQRLLNLLIAHYIFHWKIHVYENYKRSGLVIFMILCFCHAGHMHIVLPCNRTSTWLYTSRPKCPSHLHCVYMTYVISNKPFSFPVLFVCIYMVVPHLSIKKMLTVTISSPWQPFLLQSCPLPFCLFDWQARALHILKVIVFLIVNALLTIVIGLYVSH